MDGIYSIKINMIKISIANRWFIAITFSVFSLILPASFYLLGVRDLYSQSMLCFGSGVSIALNIFSLVHDLKHNRL